MQQGCLPRGGMRFAAVHGRRRGAGPPACERGTSPPVTIPRCQKGRPAPFFIAGASAAPRPISNGIPMLNRLLTRVFGSRNERLLGQLGGIVKKVNALEPQMQALSDEQLKGKTPEFQARIRNGESLDKLLPEAFAVCREAS